MIENLVAILQDWLLNLQQSLPQIIAGVLVFILSLYLARLLSRALSRAMQQRDSDPESTVLLSRIVRWSIVLLGLVIALEQAGQDVSALIASLGIIGFTVGFALQDVSSNLVAGLLLLYQQPFGLGDTIDVAGHTGEVETINLRATEIRTLDGLLVMIPNKDIYTNTITNYTRTNNRRIEHIFTITAEADVEQVMALLIQAFEAVPEILKDPTPAIKFAAFGDFGVNLTAYVWYDTLKTDYTAIVNASAIAIKQALEEADIDMPFPTQTLLVKQE